MNNTVKTIIEKGHFSEKNLRIEAKGYTGWVDVRQGSIISREELDALISKFGGDVCARCGLVANDAAAVKLANEKEAEAGTAQAKMAELTNKYTFKGCFGTHIRHGFADE